MVSKQRKNGKDIFIIIDANSIIHRAFHSYPPTLETSKGIQVNAVFGFASMFLKVLELMDPKYIVCAFDTAKPTFRHTKYVEYKATRKPTDQSLLDQFPIVEGVVKAFNIPILKREGFEADDIIGTVSEYIDKGKWSNSNTHLCIVSSDNDLLQLVSENVTVILPQGNFKNLKEFNREEVFEKLSVYPEQVVDYKALVGDTSDNIPGIKGVGAKTAVNLLNEYSCLEGIYSNISNLKGRTRTLLEEGVEQASLSKELATIVKEVDIMVNLEDCLEKDFEYNEVFEKFIELEFRTLINKIPESIGEKEKKDSEKKQQIGLFEELPAVKISEDEFDEEKFKEALESSQEARVLFLDTHETNMKESCLIVGCGGQEFILKPNSFELFVSQVVLKPIGFKTYFYNFTGFLRTVELRNEQYLVLIDMVYEIKVLAHVESSGKKNDSFSTLCFEYISRHLPEILDIDLSSKYLEYLGEIFGKIFESLKEREIDFGLFNKELNFLEWTSKKENTLSVCLSLMERRGICMDSEVLKKYEEKISKEIDDLTKQIYYDIGHEFNINSPSQLSDILFNELGLQKFKKTKKSYSTNEEVLKKLVEAHPVISKILEYRKKTKILSTYINAYMEFSEEGVINTSFKQTGTTSGRLSSINPNMQNLPVGDEDSDRLREIFVPRKNFVFVSADYSQIDLRIMAHLSGDKNLIEDFNMQKDIHLSTAARILDKSEEDVTSAERRVGKTINFGIIYGLTSFGLSESLKISFEKAQEYIEEYFENYSGVAEYIKDMSEKVTSKGWVETILGRRRYVPGVNSRNVRIQKASIREAINMPVQGGSADIMKLAMVDVYGLILEKYSSDVFMLLQIHDEILFEVKESVLKDFEDDVKEIMNSVITLKVPLEVHISSGSNMSELK